MAIVHAILALARGLGVETTAEGVETEAQAEVMRQLGCTSSRASTSAGRSRADGLDAGERRRRAAAAPEFVARGPFHRPASRYKPPRDQRRSVPRAATCWGVAKW